MTSNEQQIGDDVIERIMQYCDGTLSPGEAARVAREIGADPKLQQLADDLARGSNLARETMSGLMKDPVPLQLARAIATAPDPAAPSPQRPWFVTMREAAAVLAGVLIGAAAIGFYQSGEQQEAGLRLASLPETMENQAAGSVTSAAMKSSLMALLQTPGQLRTLSYKDSTELNKIATISLVSWFQMSDGSDCAEFRVQNDSSDASYGFACQRGGRWDVVMLQDVAGRS